MEISFNTCLAGLSIALTCARAGEQFTALLRKYRDGGHHGANHQPSLLTLYAGAAALAYGHTDGNCDFLMLSASSLNLIGVMLTEAVSRGLAFTPKVVASPIRGGSGDE